MAVTDQTPIGNAVGNGVTTIYPFGYYVPDAGDLVVQINGLPQTLNVDYTLTGIGNEAGGQIIFAVAPAAGANVSHFRDTVLDRSTDYQTSGDLFADTLDSDIDRVWFALQEIFSGGKSSPNALRVPPGETVPAFPRASLRINKVPFFDGLGQPALADLTGLSVVIGDMGAVVVKGDGVTPNASVVATANLLATASGKSLSFQGISVVNSPVTITAPIQNGPAQIFSTNSQITINNGAPVTAEWFGTSTGYGDRAVNALPIPGGGIVDFYLNSAAKAFDHAYNAGYLSKANVTLRGRKMPQLANDCRSLTGGTILRGMVQVYADNFEIREIGVDMGKNTSEQLYGGAQAVGITEGLVITYPSDALKSGSPLKRGVKLHNVIGLGPDPGSPTHAIIMGEGVTDVTTTGQVIGAMALHPLVFKCANVNANALEGYLGNGEGLIIKSDSQTTSISRDIQIKSIVLSAQGPTGVAPFTGSIPAVGLQIQAQAGAIDKIQIGQAKIVGYPKCANASFGGPYGIISVSIDSLLTDCFGVAGTTYGIDLTSAAGQNIQQWTIGTLEARNCTAAGHFAFSQTADLKNHLSIGRIYAKNCNFALDIGGQSYVDVGTVVTDTCTDAVYRFTGTPKLSVGQLFKDTLTPAVYSSTSGGLVPALAGTWSQVAGNDPFGVDLLGGRVWLRGLIKPGAAATCAVLPQWARPLTVKRCLAQGYGGSGQVAVPVTIDTAGNVNVNEVAGGTANCTNWLSLSGISFDTQA